MGDLSRATRLRRAYVVTVPAPNVSLTFSAGVAALERIEEARKAREDRMRNALEILASVAPEDIADKLNLDRFVRATAREGLGRDPVS